MSGKLNTSSPVLRRNNDVEQKSSTTATVLSSHTIGWGKFRPKCLQRFCTAKWALFWLCWAGAMQGLIVNGLINVVITTIEKRFGLRSRQTGLVASGYDIASFICLIPVTYFGGRTNSSKSRIIATGLLLLGLGSLVFSIPHFLVGHYRVTAAETNTCSVQTNATNATIFQYDDERNTNGMTNDDYENPVWFAWLFFVAQMLHGAGASPLFTLGVTYIDENVSKKMSSVYLGIYYTMAMMGPAFGYVVGGQLLLVYTDFLYIDSSELGLTSDSKVWIGAWWVGFLIAALLCFLLAISISGYPKVLPGAEKFQQQKNSEAYNDNKTYQGNSFNYTKFKELPLAVAVLLKNPTFFFLNLAGASEGMIIAGFAAFLPKLIENQFSISPVLSALIMGLITIPTGGGGTFLGGYLVKKFDLSCGDIIRLCLIATTIATAFTSCFLLSCPNLDFAGVTIDYHKNQTSEASLNAMQLEDACNANCSCNRDIYDPVCGIDDIMYYSPCFAGCSDESVKNDEIKSYVECECIRHDSILNHTSNFEAVNLICSSKCSRLPYFVMLCFALMLFTFLATMPALSATLRCVYDDQRSFALGIQWIKVRLLGTIPAPMIFGTLIDETCLLWQQQRGDHQSGACLVYENFHMSKYMWLLAFVGKLCSVVFFFAAWWFYIPPKQHVVKSNNSGTNNIADISTIDAMTA
uniref:Solute carrier organic anion transporter family member n=1 Tax=Glossina pallidipes TaxID=7398 RepID=A0A1A9ZVS2_GLOPL